MKSDEILVIFIDSKSDSNFRRACSESPFQRDQRCPPAGKLHFIELDSVLIESRLGNWPGVLAVSGKSTVIFPIQALHRPSIALFCLVCSRLSGHVDSIYIKLSNLTGDWTRQYIDKVVTLLDDMFTMSECQGNLCCNQINSVKFSAMGRR